LGVRATKKQATRERVLAAARDLFDAAGFEATTVRLIAQQAGVSVGSVFTSFASKAEILGHVMVDRLGALYAELEQVLPLLRGSTADRLRSVMAIHNNFEMRRPRLFMAYIGASFDSGAGVLPLGRNARLKGMLHDILAEGIERGEVNAEVDLELFVDALLGVYLWNYRRIALDGYDTAGLTELMDKQIGLLLDGAGI
jgi:AcrR family transcriptional regulator